MPDSQFEPDELSSVVIDNTVVRRILGYFRPYWSQVLIAFACLLAEAGVALVPALVTKQLVDSLTKPGATFLHVAWLIGVGLAAAVVGGLIGLAKGLLGVRISQGIMYTLRGQLFDRLLRQSVGFFTSTRTGEVMSRIGNDVRGIQDVVSDSVLGVASNALVLPATLILMCVLNWRLAIAAVLVLPIVILPTRRMGRKTYQARKRTQGQLAQMTAYLQEVLGISGMLLVKAFVKQRAERQRFEELNEGLRKLELRQAMILRWFYALMDVVQAAAPAAVWLFGAFLVLRGEASLGTVVTFIVLLMGRLYGSVAALGGVHVEVMGSLALFQRIFGYLDLPPEVADRPGSRPANAIRGAVRFDDVTFNYGSSARPAVEQMSFRIEPGQLAALVGPTGAGKSTVTYLVARFYDPQEGRVLIDGIDVRDITLESLTSHIGVVFQDTFLFHASLRENLRYARPDASDEQIQEAVRAAQLEEFVASLPDGYDTIVGERGHRLSGGERQRVAIARVILKEPRIIILDEATSNLDTVAEQLIQAALRPLFAGRTSLVVAHRLSTVLAADLLLVLDHGRLVEQGTHQELLAMGGLYAELYRRQFEPQAVGTPPLSPV